MREIDDLQHAEDERQPRRDKEQRHANDQGARCLRDNEAEVERHVASVAKSIADRGTNDFRYCQAAAASTALAAAAGHAQRLT